VTSAACGGGCVYSRSTPSLATLKASSPLGSAVPRLPLSLLEEAYAWSQAASVEAPSAPAASPDFPELRCEVSILGAELPPVLDAQDFHSTVLCGSYVQSNEQMSSTWPHEIKIATEEELRQQFVHIIIAPRRPSRSGATVEFETFVPLLYILRSSGHPVQHPVQLGMVPRGSGASPASIFQCACAGPWGGHAARVSLACSMATRGGGSLPRPLASANGGLGSSTQFKLEQDEPPASPQPQRLRSLSPQHCPSSSSFATTAQTREDAGLAPGARSQEAASRVDGEERDLSATRDGEATELREALERAQNELRMQQTLLRFQGKRLQDLEASSATIDVPVEAAGGAQRPLQLDHNTTRQVEDLQDIVRRQQDEIAQLREQLRLQMLRDERTLEQTQMRTRMEMELRDQRIAELQAALEERERQLDVIPDAVDLILRSPPRQQGQSNTAGGLSTPDLRESSFGLEAAFPPVASIWSAAHYLSAPPLRSSAVASNMCVGANEVPTVTSVSPEGGASNAVDIVLRAASGVACSLCGGGSFNAIRHA